jgi:hypothetical protein
MTGVRMGTAPDPRTGITPVYSNSDGRAMHYLSSQPRRVPPGFVLVHNHVLRNRVLAGLPHPLDGRGGWGGRAWLEEAPLAARLARCDCGWLNRVHYWPVRS